MPNHGFPLGVKIDLTSQHPDDVAVLPIFFE
jgi:hypothetical protein